MWQNSSSLRIRTIVRGLICYYLCKMFCWPKFRETCFSLAMHSGCCTKHVLHHDGGHIYNKMANQLQIGPVSSIISVIWNQYVTCYKDVNVANQQWLEVLKHAQKTLYCHVIINMTYTDLFGLLYYSKFEIIFLHISKL